MRPSELIKNILKFCIPTVVSSIIAIAVLPISSRLYPAEEYGYISNFFSIGNTVMGVVLLGLDSAYVRFFYDPPRGSNRNGIFGYTLLVGIGTTIIITVIVFFCFPYAVSRPLFNENNRAIILLLGVYICELTVFRMFNLSMRYSENALGYNLQQIFFVVCNRLLYLIALVFSTNYIWAVLIMTGSMLILDTICVAYQRNELLHGIINLESKKELYKYAIPMIPVAIITFANNSIAKVVLGTFDYRRAVGVMAIATSASNIFAIVPNAFRIYWSAFMIKHYEDEKKLIITLHDVIMFTAILMTIGVLLIQDLIYSYLGANYRDSQQYFMLLMLTPITSLIVETTVYGVYIEKRTEKIFIVFFVGLIFNIISCYLLVPGLGALGAAIGVAVSASIIFFTQSYLGQKYYKSVKNVKRTIVGCIIIWSLCIGNVWMYNNYRLRLVLISMTIIITCFIYGSTICKILRYINISTKRIYNKRRMIK